MLGVEEEAAVLAPLRRGWVMQGPEVEAFEEEFCAYTGAPHSCAVSSGTAAIHLALLAVGVGPGDEVITVSHSYIATANAVRMCGAIPVFADVRPDTFNMAVPSLVGLFSEKTRAILCVHQLGMPCDLAEIAALARQHGVALVEDAACAIGSEIRWGDEWQRIGAPHSDAATFSFHPRKVITTGDGGMVCTRNPELHARVRLLRQHGLDPTAPASLRRGSTRSDAHLTVAYNYRLTDIQAAVGRVQCARLPTIIPERRRLAARYAELLNDITAVTLPAEPDHVRSNWQSFCLIINPVYDRDALMLRLKDAGIASRPGVMCAHLEPAYHEEPWRAPVTGLPVSETIWRHGLMLPLYPGLEDEDLVRVVTSLVESLPSCIASRS